MKIVNKNKTLKEYLEQINDEPNKIKVFVDILRELHELPIYDNNKQSLGGRVAGLIKACNKDYNRLMHIIWDTKDTDLVGSRLDYLMRIASKNNRVRNYSQRDVVKNNNQISQRYEIQGDMVVDKETGRRFDVNCPIGRMLKSESGVS